MYRNHMQNNCCNYNCNMNNNSCEYDNDENYYLEPSCKYVENVNECYDDCKCGFDEEKNMFPENPMFGQSYVPIHEMNRIFIPCVGLKMGTIYPELVSPYMPGQSQTEIEYLSANNSIKEGCNR